MREKQSENNLASLLAVGEPGNLALCGQNREITYEELNQLVAAGRDWLTDRGVQPGDRVALSLPNVAPMPVFYYALLSLGAIVVPLNPLLSAREVSFHLENSGARLLVGWQGTRAEQEKEAIETEAELVFIGPDSRLEPSQKSWEPVPVYADEPAVLLYTSGTTGKPKGATLTHRNLLSNARTVAETFIYTPEDVFFGGLPLFHAFGQTVSMNAVFAAGATIALLARFTPADAAALCESAGVSVLAAVPSMYGALAKHLEDRDVSGLHGSIRFGISGGSALPASVHEDFNRLLDCPIYEGYGLSETSPVVTFNQARFGLVVGSVGRPLPGVEVAVRAESGVELPSGKPGQLWVRGENVMAGYWQDDAATAASFDGDWFATGDIARIDDEGNVYIVDRIKDMILRNGYSIYPREIEDVIYTHPGVHLVAVVGKPSDRVGEEVCAVLVPKSELDLPQQEQLVAELDELCRTKLAAYKYPRQFKIVSELPLGPTGKILKREL